MSHSRKGWGTCPEMGRARRTEHSPVPGLGHMATCVCTHPNTHGHVLTRVSTRPHV